MKKAEYEQLIEDLRDLLIVWEHRMGTELQCCIHCSGDEVYGHRGDCPVLGVMERMREAGLL